MHFGVVNLFGIAAPTVGYVNESRKKQTIREVTVEDEDGITVISEPDPLIEIDVDQSGKGDPQFADVTAGDFTAGEVKITEAELEESWDDFPSFKRIGKAFDTWTAPV